MGSGSSSLQIHESTRHKISKLKEFYSEANIGPSDESFDKILHGDSIRLLSILSTCVRHYNLSHMEIGSHNIFRVDTSTLRVIQLQKHDFEGELYSNTLRKDAGININEGVIASIENLELTNLGCLLSSRFESCSILGVKASYNNLSDVDLTIFGASKFQKLRHLGLAGNKLSNVLNICITLPLTIHVLDLSYCNLTFQPKCFVFSPNIKSLILDGCGIKSTFHSESEYYSKSIFFGLVCLEELSLRDNNLADEESLIGLLYFSTSRSPKNKFLFLSTSLRSINLDGNPCASSKSTEVFLLDNISSLQSINGQKQVSFKKGLFPKNRYEASSTSCSSVSSAISDGGEPELRGYLA